MTKTLDDKKQFRIELFFALVITGAACCAGFSNLLFAPNDLYPAATDFMGHMAKVGFLAEAFSRGEFPSWFPYWYESTAVSQYYPPLSYWIMALIFMAAHNVILTFKIYSFIMLFSGAFGVWLFCRIYVGKWCGLFGAVVFCLQPYILLTTFREAQIAQEPIMALAPWYLMALLSHAKNPTSKKFLMCTLLCLLLILSHANTTFMLCICIGLTLLALAFLKKITVQSFVFTCLSIAFAGVLSAFWSFIGVTGLENPGTPEVLIENVKHASAKIDWFTNTNPASFFIFAIPVSVGSLLAILIFVYSKSKKKEAGNDCYILFLIIFTVFTAAFSFGIAIPFMKYVPMADTFFAGRILSLTSVSAAILCAYVLHMIWQVTRSTPKNSIKAVTLLISFVIIGITLVNMNPYKYVYNLYNSIDFDKMISTINIKGENFEKGRYDFHLSSCYSSAESYFPLVYKFNTSQGFNIEGTPHNNTLWNENIAVASGDFSYIAKNYAFWNVRLFLIQDDFKDSFNELIKKYSFECKAERSDNGFYYSNTPSSYFLFDNRNALLFGAGAPGFATEFPYLVNEQRNDISDYSFKELEQYKVIYLCEPPVNTASDKKNIESMVEKLVNKGITVIIEPAATKGYSLFGVTASDVKMENSPIIVKQSGSEIISSIEQFDAEKK